MSPDHRRKSIDSSDSDSSSSSSSDSDSSHKKYGKVKDKKDKKDKKSKKDKMEHIGAPGFPQLTPPMPQPHFDQQRAAAPIQQAPSSGFRIPLHSSSTFPRRDLAGPPPCQDLDGSPVYIGSAIFDKSVHPCKIGPHLHIPCSVAYGGGEVGHQGRYDLLPFTPDTMEFVRTSQGRVPAGRRPVEGGYEEDGTPLYHAVGVIDGVKVPGKTGAHLGGCNVSFGGGEHVVRDNYEILCWK